jgi:S-adenosylmethionine hydrolase
VIVTLLTDFGLQDHFVAAMKGVILTLHPAATLVDVTHEVPPQDVESAAYTLGAVHSLFPPGTIHLAVVDPGVGSARRPLALEAAGQRFVGPDNGLFTPILDRDPEWRAFEIAERRFLREPVSDTFHGRDVFAPAAGALARGVPASELGPPVRDPVRLPDLPVVRGEAEVRGAVVHVDRFGNCITNLGREELGIPALREGFVLEIGGRRVGGLRRSYAGAPEGQAFPIWGSSGLLEISVNRGSAAEFLGARRGTPVVAHPA